jgi:TetR/AcrR family transcriptional regulator
MLLEFSMSVSEGDFMLSRKEREKEERRNFILEKAQSLFASKGYLGTSMAEIALASEFAVGSLYSFFNSKEEILATIFENHIEGVISQIKSIKDSPGMAARQKIEASMEALVRIYVENQDFFRIYVAEARGVEWGVRTQVGEYIYNGSLRYMRILADIITEAKEEGVVASDLDPEFVALLFRSFVHSSAGHYLYGGRSISVDELVGVAKRVFFDGIKPR